MGIREIELSGEKLVIHELDDVYDSVTGRPLTGSWLWDSSLVLSHWISTHGRAELDFHGKSVLELGAGTGLPGLTAALLGATRVVLTDIGPILPGLLTNVEANGLGDRVEVRELVWGSDQSLTQGSELGEFDLVLMSDVFYDPEEVVWLGETLKKVSGERTVVWAACEIRPWTSECVKELVVRGFGVAELPSQLRVSCPELELDQDKFVVFQLMPPKVDNGYVALSCT